MEERPGMKKKRTTPTRAQCILESVISMRGLPVDGIQPEDTLIQRVTSPDLQCGTCGFAFKPGVVPENVTHLQCPSCQTGVSLARGEEPYTTKVGKAGNLLARLDRSYTYA